MRVWSSDHWTLRGFTLFFRLSRFSFPAQPSFLSVHSSLLPPLCGLLAALEEPQGSPGWVTYRVLAPSLSSPKAAPKPGIGSGGLAASAQGPHSTCWSCRRAAVCWLRQALKSDTHTPRALWTLPTSQPQCCLGSGVLSWRTRSP